MKREKPELGELADPAKQQSSRERAKLKALQVAADWDYVLGTPAGRRVIAGVLRQCGVGSVPFHDNDRYQTFLLGQMNIGNLILATARKASLEKVRWMEDEERDERNND